MLSKEFRKRIEERFGREIRSSSDCEAFAADVFQRTRHNLGDTSAKRMFGLTSDKHAVHRGSTMDVLAMYLGYKDMRDLADHLGESSDISMFVEVEELDFDELESGAQVQITYEPGRLLLMTYLGDNLFIVNESQRSKLHKGDKLRIAQLAKGFELLVSNVERDGIPLGSYHSAKDGGLTSIELIN